MHIEFEITGGDSQETDGGGGDTQTGAESDTRQAVFCMS